MCVYLCVCVWFSVFKVLHRSEESSIVRVSHSDWAQVTDMYYAWEKGRQRYKKHTVIFTVTHAAQCNSAASWGMLLKRLNCGSPRTHQIKPIPGKFARHVPYLYTGNGHCLTSCWCFFFLKCIVTLPSAHLTLFSLPPSLPLWACSPPSDSRDQTLKSLRFLHLLFCSQLVYNNTASVIKNHNTWDRPQQQSGPSGPTEKSLQALVWPSWLPPVSAGVDVLN